jgi:acetyl-CoA carboxylase biotin carboxylase subunit
MGDLQLVFQQAALEASAAFGDGSLYVEKLVAPARHVEVQVLGDGRGRLVHVFERECSLQRRRQKLIEESPSPALDAPLREAMTSAALRVARAVDYVSAGTVEFLLDANGAFYFIEMNTRIQVEHPVTEMVTGLDLVLEQIRIAAGKPLGYRQESIVVEGHAVECRINAEDPETFAPSAGRVTAWLPPGGFGVRVDSHLMAPYSVPPFYDSLVAKVVVHGRDRAEAVERMRRALGETLVEGVKTSVPFQLKVLADPAFVEGRFTSADGRRLLG